MVLGPASDIFSSGTTCVGNVTRFVSPLETTTSSGRIIFGFLSRGRISILGSSAKDLPISYPRPWKKDRPAKEEGAAAPVPPAPGARATPEKRSFKKNRQAMQAVFQKKDRFF